MKMEQIECSETSACKIQAPGNYPEENIQPMSYLIVLLNFITLNYVTYVAEQTVVLILSLFHSPAEKKSKDIFELRNDNSYTIFKTTA
jgi:hypothetical protein